MSIQANVVGSPNDFACTESQADERETVFAQSLPPGASNTAAADALLQRLQAMRDELEAKLPQSDCDRV